MSTASTGKAREREVVDLLEEIGLTAERVPRSVADATPVDDVICTSHEIEADHDRPITRQLQRVGEGLDLGDVLQVEVKYRSDNGFGASTIYSKHLRTVGLGGVRPVSWSGGVYTGGVRALAAHRLSDSFTGTPWECEETLPQSATDLLEPPEVDVAAVRLAREPWVFLWGVAA